MNIQPFLRIFTEVDASSRTFWLCMANSLVGATINIIGPTRLEALTSWKYVKVYQEETS